MIKDDFFKLLDIYKKTKDKDIKNTILSIAYNNPTWLITPSSDKSTWSDAAKLLICLEYSIIKQNLKHILEWYQDINWPGTDILTKYLLNIPKEDLINAISQALIDASGDECWLFGLVSLIIDADVLNVFVSNEQFRDLLIKSDYFDEDDERIMS